MTTPNLFGFRRTGTTVTLDAGFRIGTNFPLRPMQATDALNLAAWVVATATPEEALAFQDAVEGLMGEIRNPTPAAAPGAPAAPAPSAFNPGAAVVPHGGAPTRTEAVAGGTGAEPIVEKVKGAPCACQEFYRARGYTDPGCTGERHYNGSHTPATA